MIGRLPTSLEVNGISYDIRTDYRDIIVIIQAFADNELSYEEQCTVMLNILYKDAYKIPENDVEEALKQAVWFLDCGGKLNESDDKPLYDFEHDEQILFSAINKVAGKEIREVEYLHYWTFLGYFNEIGEGVFSTVISIRQKRAKGKKLEQWEKDFYNKNRSMVDLPKRLTKEEEEEEKLLKDFFG